MSKLGESRLSINRIDKEMAKLFEERMKAAADIAEYKKQHGLSVRDTARENELIHRNRALLSDAELESYYVQFLRGMIDVSCSYQSKLMNGMKVAYCGTKGAYAYIAAKKMFPEATLLEMSSFGEVYRAVECGVCDAAVLPLENSYAGEVGEVMDLMFSGNLYVNQVIDVPIVHNLLAPKGAKLSDIKTVVSHRQALDQCAGYLKASEWAVREYSNTALAAKAVAEAGDITVAAIASEETANIFGLEVLERDINDSKNNTTRFAAFSLLGSSPAPTVKRVDESFILVFTVQNEAGALAKALNIIGAHGFNMRSLRSRPMKSLQWSYYFYIEAEGNVNTENGSDMLRALSAVCAKLRMAGSYFTENIRD